ncbi:MAG TPA: F0F1 ATP synthase subunit delta [Planctomycetota bacterium]|nr:F0F1 ATP synthase subunit delta [Planctomycetota bacterium]
MRVDWTNVVLQAVNFVVLVWILRRVLYGRVLDVIARRKAEIEAQLAAAAAERERACAEAAAASAMTAVAAKEGDRALEMAHARASVEAEKLHEAARREADAIVESGRKRVAEERDEAATKVQEAAARLSVSLAERLLQELDRGAVTRLLLERTIARIESLPPDRLGALRREARQGEISVATAAEVETAERVRIAKRLGARLGVTAEHVTFTVDPSLVAGAEVRFPSSSVAFTWHGALEQLGHEVTRGDAR